MANINVNGATIYSNDGTQTAATVVIGANTIKYSGVNGGTVFAGPEEGTTVIDGLTLSGIAPSASLNPVMIKNSLISDSTSALSGWSAVLYMNGTSVIIQSIRLLSAVCNLFSLIGLYLCLPSRSPTRNYANIIALKRGICQFQSDR